MRRRSPRVRHETDTVVAFAKQTGDYAVLSPADLHVLALTYALEVEAHGTWRIRETVGGKTGQQQHEERRLAEKGAQGTAEPKAADVMAAPDASDGPTPVAAPDASGGFTPVTRKSRPVHSADDDDEEGEWITPENITQHKNKSLGLVGDDTVAEDAPKKGRRRRGRKGAPARMSVACMTGDFAVQNVLLQMGLYLVGVDGLRIERVKSWVLRCHACYKICPDVERKFCPSCGNATLLRTSVTAGDSASGLQVHLKPNFQYKNRGTVYSLPLPRAGSASGGQASGRARNRQTGVPILREDQLEWQRATAKQRTHRQKEERALQKALAKGQDSLTARYADPDWVPDLLRGTHAPAASDLPALGIGRRNPNERRRRKR